MSVSSASSVISIFSPVNSLPPSGSCDWTDWQSRCSRCCELPTNQYTAFGKIKEMVSLLDEVAAISKISLEEGGKDAAIFLGTLDVLRRVSDAERDSDHWLGIAGFASGNLEALNLAQNPNGHPMSTYSSPQTAIMRGFYECHFKMAESLLKELLKFPKDRQLNPEDVVSFVQSARKSLGDSYEQYLKSQLEGLRDHCTAGRGLQLILSEPWVIVMARMEEEGKDPVREGTTLAPVGESAFREIMPFWLLMSREAQQACLKNSAEDWAQAGQRLLIDSLYSSDPFVRSCMPKNYDPQFLESQIGRHWRPALHHLLELKARMRTHRFVGVSRWLSPEQVDIVTRSSVPRDLEPQLSLLDKETGSEILKAVMGLLEKGQSDADTATKNKNREIASKLSLWLLNQDEGDSWGLPTCFGEDNHRRFDALLQASMPIQRDENEKTSLVRDLRMEDPDSDLSKILRGESPAGPERQPLVESTSSRRLTEIQNSLKSDQLSKRIAQIKEGAWNIVKSAVESGRVRGAKISADKKYCILFEYNGKKIEVFFEPQVKQVAWVDAKRTKGSSMGPEIADVSFRLVGDKGEEIGAADLAFFLGWTDNWTGRYLHTKVPSDHPLPALLKKLAQVANRDFEAFVSPSDTVIKTTHLSQIVPGATEEVGEDGALKACGTMGYFLFKQYQSEPRLRMALDSSGAVIFIAITASSGTQAIYCQKDGQEHWAYLASDQTQGDIRTNLAATHIIDEVNAIGQKIANQQPLTEQEQETYAKFFEGMVQIIEVPLISKNDARDVRLALMAPKIRDLHNRWIQLDKDIDQALGQQMSEFLRIADLSKMEWLRQSDAISSKRTIVALAGPSNAEAIEDMLTWLQGPLVTRIFGHLQNRRYDLILEEMQKIRTPDERKAFEALYHQIKQIVQRPSSALQNQQLQGRSFFDMPGGQAGGSTPLSSQVAGMASDRPFLAPMTQPQMFRGARIGSGIPFDDRLAGTSNVAPNPMNMGGGAFLPGSIPGWGNPQPGMLYGAGPESGVPYPMNMGGGAFLPGSIPGWENRQPGMLYGKAPSAPSFEVGEPVQPGEGRPSRGYSSPSGIGSVQGRLVRGSREAVLARMYAGPLVSRSSSQVSEVTQGVLKPLQEWIQKGYVLDLRTITMISLEILLAQGPDSLNEKILADRFLRQMPQIFKACLEASKEGDLVTTRRAIDGT